MASQELDGGNHRGQTCGAKGQRQRRAYRLGPGTGLPFSFSLSMTHAPGQSRRKRCSRDPVPAGTRDKTGRPDPAQPPPRRQGTKGSGFWTCHRLTISGFRDTQIPHCVSQGGNVTRGNRQNLSGLLGGTPGQDPTWRTGGTVAQGVFRDADYARLKARPYSLSVCLIGHSLLPGSQRQGFLSHLLRP